MPSLVDALDKLEQHILDRVAASATLCPRSGVMLAGQAGLERRQQWTAVESIAAESSKRQMLNEYLAWLPSTAPEDDLD